MLKIAFILLVAKLGIWLFADEFADVPFIQLALLAYLALSVSFVYLVIVNGVERILGWIEPSQENDYVHDGDEDLIDPEWLEQTLNSIVDRSHLATVTLTDDDSYRKNTSVR